MNFVVVFGTTALTNMASFNPNLLIHNQEEADTGIVLHALDFCKSDSLLQVVVSCPNTNVSLLLLNYFDVLNSCTIFNTSHQVYYLQNIFENLNPKADKSLFGFHAFSGCDQTGKFHGFSKKPCWETLVSANDDISVVFDSLGNSVNVCVDNLLMFKR